MDEFPINFLIGLPPEQAIQYLKAKGYRITFNWQEMLDQAHNKAFTVAKAMKLDILQDIKSALETAQQNGETFEQFRRKLTPELKRKGWWGRVPADQVPTDTPVSPVSSESPSSVQLGSPSRLRTIYNTNIRSSLMAGKYQRFIANASNRPYWQYIAILDKSTRPAHAELDGKVFKWNDPIWNTIWPPNDWGCRCDVRALTQQQLNSMGLTISNSAQLKFTPAKGFRHNPGLTQAWVDEQSPETVSAISTNWKSYNLPALSDFPDALFPQLPPRLPRQNNAASALDQIANQIGLKDSLYIKTPVEDVLITKDLLRHVVLKHQDHREIFANAIIPTLTDPFEIWINTNGKDIARSYLKVFMEDGKKKGMLDLVIRRDGSVIWTIYPLFRESRINTKRSGILIYKGY